ncbi:sugar ABC transporter substrate-binding protein [Devriesea agamarum]|uniref:sugar ABC transporter substrate-binding protein n=1 Tax=Devriesea agamarum TaxID=472569 RepID=UPI00071D6DB3|nr:extracellular solute-binding protein [Devriesea agamarum]
MTLRRKSFLALSAGLPVAIATGCGSSSSHPDSAGSTPKPGSDKGADLTIWADGKKAPSLTKAATEWGQRNGLTVSVQTVAKDLMTNFVTANQAGNGPDIVIGAHDWIGNLVQNSSITPMQLEQDATKDIAPTAMKAVTYQGQVYGLPYSVETLVIYANKKLTSVAEPTTFEEMIAAGKAGGAELPLSLPVGQEGDAYNMEPIYTSAGGYLFGEKDGNYDPKDLGVGKEGSIAAAEKILELGKQGILKTSVTVDNAISLFTDGKAAYLSSGPWALSDIKKAGIDVSLVAWPQLQGMQPARPFAGVNAFYVASKAKNPGNANQFIADLAASTEIFHAMFQINQLPPVNSALQKQLAADNPEMVKIAQLAESAQPMPAIPAMAAVWKPLGQAQASIIGGADPKTTMMSAGEHIAAQIK